MHRTLDQRPEGFLRRVNIEGERLSSLVKELSETVYRIQADTALNVLGSEPTSAQFIYDRIEEILFESLTSERERYLEQLIKERADLGHQLSSVRQQAQDSIEFYKNANLTLTDQNTELQRSNKQLRETIQQLARRSQLSGNSEMVNEIQSMLGNFKETLTQEMINTSRNVTMVDNNQTISRDVYLMETKYKKQKLKTKKIRDEAMRLQSIVAEAEKQKVELRERYTAISQKLESLLQLEQVEAQKSLSQTAKLKAYKSKLKEYKAANSQLKEELESQKRLAQKFQKKVDMSMLQSFGLPPNPPTNLSLTRDYVLRTSYEEDMKSVEQRHAMEMKESETKLEERYNKNLREYEEDWRQKVSKIYKENDDVTSQLKEDHKSALEKLHNEIEHEKQNKQAIDVEGLFIEVENKTRHANTLFEENTAYLERISALAAKTSELEIEIARLKAVAPIPQTEETTTAEPPTLARQSSVSLQDATKHLNSSVQNLLSYHKMPILPQINQIIQGYEAQIEQILQLTHLESVAKANSVSAKQYLNQISEMQKTLLEETKLRSEVQAELNKLTFERNQLESENVLIKEAFDSKVKTLLENNEQLQTNCDNLQASNKKLEQDLHRLRVQTETIIKSMVTELSLSEKELNFSNIDSCISNLSAVQQQVVHNVADFGLKVKQLEIEVDNWQNRVANQAKYYQELVKNIITYFELPLDLSLIEENNPESLRMVKEKSATLMEQKKQEEQKIQLERATSMDEKQELSGKLDFLEAEYNDLENKLSQQDSVIKSLQLQISNSEDQKAKLEDVLRNHQLSNEELNTLIYERDNYIAELKSSLAETQRAFDEKKLQLDYLLSNKDEEARRLLSQLDSNRNLVNQQESELKVKQSLIDEQKLKLQETYSKLLQSEMEANKVIMQNDDLAHKIQLQEMELEQRHMEISNLRVQLSEMRLSIPTTNPLSEELLAAKQALSNKDEEITQLKLNVAKLDETINTIRETTTTTTTATTSQDVTKYQEEIAELRKKNHKLKEEAKKLTIKVKKDREFLRTLKKNLTEDAKEKENTKTSILEKVVSKDKQIAKLNDMLEQSLKEVTVESIMNSSVLGSRSNNSRVNM